MKKILLTMVAAISMAATASAQLTEGSVFPYPGGTTGRLTAVNAPFAGNHYNLDSLSDAGYTIFLDIFATWCPPCWAYHNSGALDSLWAQHGPAGAPGVDATTTNDVFVMMIQGEPTSMLAELYANTAGGAIVTTGESDLAHDCQGNWTLGLLPIVDDTNSTDATYSTNAIDGDLHIAYFPTVYMICRDHLVHVMSQPTTAVAYAAAQATCPSTPPATGANVDAKASTYAGSGYFVCNAAPSVTFQNYSTTSSITSATVTVTDATGATVATVPWTGSLAPYALANVSIPSFAGTSFGGYQYNVAVTGDITPANNISIDSVFKVYTASNAGTLPFTDNLMGAITYKYDFPSDGSIGLPNPAWGGCPDPSGTTTNKYLLFDYFDFSAGTGMFDFVVGNFNTTGLATTFKFDEAYQIYSSSNVDAMAVKVSNDCGATWNTVWSASGSSLASITGTNTSGYVPTAASDWALRTVPIPSTYSGANMMIKLTGTSGYGNYAWVTDLDLTGIPTSVAQVNSTDFISVTPNPAKDVANVNITVNEPTTVMVQVYDAVGRMVNTVSQDLATGDQKIAISTADLATGLYYVKISAGTNVTTKQLSVVK